MSRQMGPGKQLMAFLASKVGMRRGVQVASFILAWGAVARALGHEPTKEEYTVHWRCSQATYYRELAVLKKVWPEDKSPQRRWEWVEANVKLPRKLDSDQAVVALMNASYR